MNHRKQNEGAHGEPLPKRSKPANFDASTTRSPIYEARRSDNRVWPQRGRPQRERRWKPNKWTTKQNTTTWQHQGIGGFSGGPPPNMNNSRYNTNHDIHPPMSWLTQTPPSGGPPFVPPGSMMGSSQPPPPQAPPTPQTPVLPPLNNIDELLQKLVSSGLVGPGGVIAPNNKAADVLPSAAALKEKAVKWPQTAQDKTIEEAAAPHNGPRNWTEWKALKLQLGQPSQH